MSIECDRVGGLNLAQGICDTDVPESAGAAKAAIDEGINSYTRYDGLDRASRGDRRTSRGSLRDRGGPGDGDHRQRRRDGSPVLRMPVPF